MILCVCSMPEEPVLQLMPLYQSEMFAMSSDIAATSQVKSNFSSIQGSRPEPFRKSHAIFRLSASSFALVVAIDDISLPYTLFSEISSTTDNNMLPSPQPKSRHLL